MHQITIDGLISLVLVASLGGGLAATPAIGVATASGSFRIDNAKVFGNGTLFEGTVVETEIVPSELQLNQGVRMLLGAATRGAIYRDRLVLQKGKIEAAGAYRVEAAGLQVQATKSESSARIVLNGTNRVLVAALAGPVRVTRDNGMLVANIPSGRALEFEPQAAGAAAPSRLTGTLQKRNGHYFLTDETAGVTVELRGQGLDKAVGKRVEVTGTLVTSEAPATGATQLITVTSLTIMGKPGKAAAGAAAGAGMAAGTKALIVGVVVAGATAGTAVGLTRGEDRPTAVSR